MIPFQNQIGLVTVEAIRKRYSTDYVAGNIAEAICTELGVSHLVLNWIICHFFLVDLASGGSIDWVYAVQNVSLTYTFELRDKGKCWYHCVKIGSSFHYQKKIVSDEFSGRYGFLLPANQIIPNSLEFIDGLKAMIKEAKSLNYLWIWSDRVTRSSKMNKWILIK